MEQMLIEFKRYCVQPQELIEVGQNEQSEKVLKDKLHDLQIIYEKFEEEFLINILIQKIIFDCYRRKLTNLIY